LPTGAKVVICDLQSQQDLNGLVGSVVGAPVADSKVLDVKRYSVRVPGRDSVYLLKITNLERKNRSGFQKFVKTTRAKPKTLHRLIITTLNRQLSICACSLSYFKLIIILFLEHTI
jgi:hypothetical protein